MSFVSSDGDVVGLIEATDGDRTSNNVTYYINGKSLVCIV